MRRAPGSTEPAPRLPDGTIDLNGQVGGGPVNSIAQGLKKGETLPLLPAAKGRWISASTRETDDPHLWCMPMGVPRSTPYPFRFVQNYTHKKPTHMFIVHEGNIHSFRQIFMDGRKHPAELDPTWFGHSIGSFDKDTLVIDSVGFNDKFWFDRQGTPHTEQLHTIERWTRVNMGTLTNEVTIDDPGAFSRPFTVTFNARLQAPGDEIMEYICQENNRMASQGDTRTCSRSSEESVGVEQVVCGSGRLGRPRVPPLREAARAGTRAVHRPRHAPNLGCRCDQAGTEAARWQGRFDGAVGWRRIQCGHRA